MMARRHQLSEVAFSRWESVRSDLLEGTTVSAHALLDDLNEEGEDAYLLAVFRGNVLDIEGKRSEALKYYLQAQEKDPRGVLAKIDLGDWLSSAGSDRVSQERAIGSYVKAMRILEEHDYDLRFEEEVLSALGGYLDSAGELGVPEQHLRAKAKRARRMFPEVLELGELLSDYGL